MRLRFTFIFLAIAAVLAVGCGSSGSSSGAGSGSSASESSTASTSGDSSTGGDSSTSGDSSTGGDSSSGAEAADSGKPLTKAEFIKKGEGICAKVPQEYGVTVNSLEEEAKKAKKPKPTTAEINSKAAVPPLYVAVESFEELTPPKGEEKQVEAIIASLESAAKGVEQKPESELVGSKSPFAEFQKLAGAYGLKGCSQL